ncbi:dihydrofolate reductase [Neisseria sp. Ec49-e6-T10]|uniref:dihydrofolate reductase n=1 Tax=Neisseria sp. Ec49-e6-T10 TaxID=3140744 RepID=UPI003EB76555
MSTLQKISLVVAMANNRAIGVNNTLPWHLPEDLKHFKAATTGKPIIMGRKTWESIGRALPNRRNIIVTNNTDYRAEGAEIFFDLNDAILACQTEPEICIIGGANIYTQTLDRATDLIITQVDLDVQADAFFPEFNQENWLLTQEEQHVSKTGIHYKFIHYVKQTT